MQRNDWEERTESQARKNMAFDPSRLGAHQSDLLRQQNLPMAFLAGNIAALIGAVIWAVITVTSGWQIGFMAVGVGVLVGYSVRIFGKGLTKEFGLIGAGCALLGVVLGNVFSVCGFIAVEESAPLLQVVTAVISQPEVILEMLEATFKSIDLLFYAIAVHMGFRLSFRKVPEQDLEAIMRQP